MSVNKIIQESIDKNPLGVKEALEEALQDRVRAALEEKYAEMTESKHDEDEDDEEDEDDLDESSLNELSPGLLKRYARTADKSVEKRKPGESDADYYKRGDKRQTGADMAFDKYKKQTKKGPMVVKKAFAKESFDLEDYTVEELEDFMVSEDFDQLDEISKKTLASYVKKAVDSKSDAEDARDRAGNRMGAPAGARYHAASRTAIKRRRGITKAVDRLAKESFDLEDYTVEELEDFMMSEEFDQLDEISKKTLGSYVKNAAAANYGSGRTDATFSDSNFFGPDQSRSAQKYNNAQISKARRKRDNRIVGVRRAVDRLAK